MLISVLVMGILTVSMSFSMRVWERQREAVPNNMPRLLDFMKWQLANFDPVTIKVENESHPIFLGRSDSMAFATDHSVKAISGGVPVVARYVYSPENKALSYAEIPLDPHHPDRINEFLQMNPEKTKTWPRFYSTQVEDFSLAYIGREEGGVSESWDNELEIPQAVLVKWSSSQESAVYTELIFPNFLFPKMAQGITGEVTTETEEESDRE